MRPGLPLALLLTPSVLTGCSTALLVSTPFDDPADAAPGAVGPLADGSQPPLGALGRNDAAPHDAAAHDAAVGMAFADAAISACSQPNPPECPATPTSALDACSPALVSLRCFYAGAFFNTSPLDISVHKCELDAFGRYMWRPAACQWDCAKALVGTRRDLPTEDCTTRPIQSCEGSFLTPQQAVDDTLHLLAGECGMVTFGLGLTFSAQGCPQTLMYSPRIMDGPPSAFECLVKRLTQVRFGCAPACAVASGSLL